MMNPEHKKEILFYYESDHANPNGDPGFENMPRLVQDGTILVTDVRIKRTIRDYAKNVLKETLFVERKKEGQAVKADDRIKELGITGDMIDGLLKITFDTPLFGALVPIRVKKKGKKDQELEDDDAQESGSAKLTGSVQFGLGKSVNEPEILTPSITSAFQGKDTTSKKTFATIGKFSIVDYALIKIHGGVNPMNFGDYYEQAKEIFTDKESKLFSCLWNGTNELITRSKWRQKSIFYIDVTYKSGIYNDLALLIKENPSMIGRGVRKLSDKPFEFKDLIDVMKARKENIVEVRARGSEEIKSDIKSLINNLKTLGINAEEI